MYGRDAAGDFHDLSTVEREGVLAALGQDLNQKAMAASKFTWAEPGKGQTFSVFLPETGETGIPPKRDLVRVEAVPKIRTTNIERPQRKL
jgi:hypothetical protein